MHGIIVNQLRQFVVSTHGRELWNRLRAETGVEMADVPAIDRLYEDADVVALVQAAAAASGADAQALLEQFARLATHFGERLDIQQPTCMLRGDSGCLLVGRLIS